MRLNLVLGTCLLLLGVGAIACGDRSDGGSGSMAPLEVSGKVIAVNAMDSTIEVRGPNDDGGVYVISEKTKVMNQKQEIGLADLAPGWHVAVDAEQVGDKVVATSVEVVDD